MPENPYESPQTEANAINPLSGRVLTTNMLFYLQGAAPWLRFVGIVSFIFMGLLVIGLLVILAGVGSLGETLGLGSAAPLVFLMYLPMLAVGFVYALFIYKFGSKIHAYLRTGDNKDLEDGFKNNKSLWTLIGVLYIISLAIMGLALIGGVLAVIVAGSPL